jgi:dTDP-4-amino-4,6-dideoxygalactose transaminase
MTAVTARVPMYDHALLYEQQKEVLGEAMRRVLERGALDWGPEVPAFEQAFAGYVGVKYAVGCNSGTAALRVALRALGIGTGDEVITVPNSDQSTTAAITSVGATPVWVDVDADTSNINVNQAAAAITDKTKALLPVDMYGHPADMPALTQLAETHGLPMIVDACLSLGASVNEIPVGQWGAVTCFSHAPSKHLGAYGSAGTAVTNDDALAQRMQRIVAYGQDRAHHYQPGRLASPPLHHLDEGLHEKLDELQAALLQAKLPDVDERIAMRIARANRYHHNLINSTMRLPTIRPNYRHTFRNYVVHLEPNTNRANVQQHLANKGIASGLPYAPPLHLHPAYAYLGYQVGDFPVSEDLGDRLLSVPIGDHVTLEMVDYVCEALLEVTA